jgi:hypothetical protein
MWIVVKKVSVKISTFIVKIYLKWLLLTEGLVASIWSDKHLIGEG